MPVAGPDGTQKIVRLGHLSSDIQYSHSTSGICHALPFQLSGGHLAPVFMMAL